MIKKNEKVRTEDVTEKLTLESSMCVRLCQGLGEGPSRRKNIPGIGISMCGGLK